jgi:lipopolysaccharide transport system ATP-binding protein
MSSEVVIKANELAKNYLLYDDPAHRLWQMLLGRFRQFYREHAALQPISLEIRRGDVVGVVGRNGAGKSTLLQLICGTLQPSAGSVNVSGRVAALLELGSGFNPEFTGRENIYMNAQILGLSEAEVDERFTQIVEFADIGAFLESPIKTYSTGMYLRLAFAVIAHVDADILIIDESLAVGDAFFTQKCMRFLRDFMQKGTILFVTHDTASVKALCNRAVWLDKGRLMGQGSPKEICEMYLEAFFEAEQGTKGQSVQMSEPLKPTLVEQPVRGTVVDESHSQERVESKTQEKRFEFDPQAPSFGSGSARITQVTLFDDTNHKVSWVTGGERIYLRIKAQTHSLLESPIVGFYIKDRLGQNLFGDNTCLSYAERPFDCQNGDRLQATFEFNMPILPCGEYSICAAIANGTQTMHVQHHWIHDALIFRSESVNVATGLIGIPMRSIEMTKLSAAGQSSPQPGHADSVDSSSITNV